MDKTNVPEIFASNVFNETIMAMRLPADIYKSLKETINEGKPLDNAVAQVVANEMKDWAIEKGATHYTHWFQPMTGVTAEKHDAFIAPTPDGKVIMEFSGKELIKGEPDASSFPSGGLRATFEARGYTAWDPTSYAFIKDRTLCIPTAFCSYSGEVLDKKTPLLRSEEEIGRQSVRVLKYFGKNVSRVSSSEGPEQEYFLVDRDLFKQRKDLIFTGRTLFGARPPKGQELDDHYFGTLKERVSAYMKELDEELWKLGVYAKTEHNEGAPAQHELAPIYTHTNIATDHNQLTMEMMKKIAPHHNLVCLLHEKPYKGVNGSGKHNNWSLSTSDGENLLKPGKNPIENKQFLLFFAAVMKAVDMYGDLIRISVATAGNDHRLGANEAPPAIVSMFIGEELEDVVNAVIEGKSSLENKREMLNTGVEILPKLRRDTTDRNRTSPFAFTGNKFEFRMPGSSQSIADINVIINTTVAESLRQFADRLDACENPNDEIENIIRETFKEHKRIIFNGNNYSEEWVEEAKRRGLPNYKTATEALAHFIDKKNIELFSKHGIFSESEMYSRYEILLAEYSKTINIEALTMLDMAKQEIIPACIKYTDSILASLALKKSSSIGIGAKSQEKLAVKLSTLTEKLIESTDLLEENLIKIKDITDAIEKAQCHKSYIVPAMDNVRDVADELELIVAKEFWPFPTYSELLFNI
ncbi:MAG: glutamine synthetase type III [Ruminococcaceae bacterium]|nr:glutamine synthetase type III [Oscillospiraceae bacterium]